MEMNSSASGRSELFREREAPRLPVVESLLDPCVAEGKKSCACMDQREQEMAIKEEIQTQAGTYVMRQLSGYSEIGGRPISSWIALIGSFPRNKISYTCSIIGISTP